MAGVLAFVAGAVLALALAHGLYRALPGTSLFPVLAGGGVALVGTPVLSGLLGGWAAEGTVVQRVLMPMVVLTLVGTIFPTLPRWMWGLGLIFGLGFTVFTAMVPDED